MRKNKELVYEFIRKESLVGGRKGLLTDDIAEKLGMQRTNVSAILNELTKEGRLEKTKTRPVYYRMPQEEKKSAEPRAFENMIGYEGSLSKAIQQAKAASLYPGSNLNIQLVSHQGSGATHFGKEIYKFALEKKRLTKDMPYIYVNCRHFSKNINALSDMLFGDIQGVENSCFAKAQGGMLFIDNVDLMDARQYSRISLYLETGEVYSEKENRTMDCSNCFFVFSTTSADSGQTDWKNSVTIELPSLSERPLSEKLELINYFFTEEAVNSGCQIEVTIEAIRALMATHFLCGIKEMRLEIKSACASAYIRVLDESEENMRVCLSDFKENVQRELHLYWKKCAEIDELIGTANFMLYGDTDYQRAEKSGHEVDAVYDNIKHQYREMTNRGISNVSIKGVIEAYIGNLMCMIPDRERKEKELNLGQLSKMVDVRILNLVGIFEERYKKDFGREFPNNIFCGLCLHLNAMLSMEPVERSRITDEQVKRVIQEYPREYAFMLDFTRILEEHLHLTFNIEETVLLTMFIIETEDIIRHPVLLYAMHGGGVAKYLAETTNKLTQENNAYAFDMDLSEETKQAMEELEKQIATIDRGGGVIVIYDMGSFQTMLDDIAQRTNIKIRGINMPITAIGVEIARRCAREQDIEQIYHLVNQEMWQILYPEVQLKKVLITLCHTSEGGAEQLKRYIEQYSRLNMRVVALAMADRDKLIQEVMKLKKTYAIHAFVGTFDPELFGIPFISISDVFESSKEDLDRVLMFEPIQKKSSGYEKVLASCEKQSLQISVNKLRKVLPGCVEELAVAYNLQEDEKVGLFAHLVSTMERLASPDYVCRKKNEEAYLEKNREDYRYVSKVLKVLERQFKVIINDSELAVILRVLKHE